MTQKIETELFENLGKDIKSLVIYPELFDSSEPKQVDGSFYLSSLDKGIYVSLSQSLKVESFVLHSQGADNYQQYQKPLPSGLAFDLSRTKVKERLGEPTKSGDAGGTGIFATPHSWDSYEIDSKFVTVQYTDNCNSISIIVIGQLQ